MMLVTARHCSSVMFSNACSARTAALLTRMSTPPKRAAAAATIFCTAAPSATSAATPSALPPARSISPATASASLRLERTLTPTGGPPSAGASAMRRPILRPARVTMATRPASSLVMDSYPQVFFGRGVCEARRVPRLCRSSAQGGKFELAVIQRPQQRQRPLRARGVPSAVAGIEHEFLLDVVAGERLVGAAAQMRLALLDDATVGKQRADMSGEIVGIRILRIDPVAHLRRKREHIRLLHRVVGEGIEPDLTAYEGMGDAIRRGEF